MNGRNLARRLARVVLPALAGLLLAGCNGDGASAPGPRYAVGGLVSGTDIGALKLTLNGGDEITLDAAGRFTFPRRLPDGAAYDVQISQQPTSPAQTCTLAAASGTVAAADVADVYVECSPLAFSILGVADTAPGQQPTITFLVKLRGQPLNLLVSPLQALRLTVAGPNEDFAGWTLATIQGSGATGTLAAVDAALGAFRYTPAMPLPLAAAGSYSLALEGYLPDPEHPGARLAGVSPVAAFAVTDAQPVPRRTVVEDARCNACHGVLTAHGTRRGVQYCATCHNPNQANTGNVARVEGQSVEVPSLDLKVMIHKIHRGSGLVRQPFLLWGSPGATDMNPGAVPHDYGTVSFPGDLGACENCHRPGTYDLPLAQGRLPSMAFSYACSEDPAADTDSFCGAPFFQPAATRQLLPEAGSCLSCHDAPHTEAHAATMTTTAGAESCATCHAIGAANGIDRYHRLKVGAP